MINADRSLLEAALCGYEIKLREVNGKIAEIRAELQSPSLKPGQSVQLPDGSMWHVISTIGAPSEKGTIGRDVADVIAHTSRYLKPKRQMSDAARKRIGAAQKRRWAAWRKAQGAK